MNKNKYFVFAAIGFELIGFIIAGILLGESAAKTTGYQSLKAIMIVVAFIAWFISLVNKLKSLEKNKNEQDK
ncbi:MAG: hypothetical protein ACK4VO_00550 [Pseudobdellovibrio sp.]